METVSVYVADDHPLYREALARAVAERAELTLLGEGTSGREALEFIRASAPDVAVLDLHLGDLDAIGVMTALADEASPTRILVLSGDVTSEIVYRAVGAGARGYLPKESTRASICDAVVAIARGETVLAPDVQAGLAEQLRGRASEDRTRLTAREQEVLALTAAGKSAAEIGKQLFLSPATVKSHLQSVYEKLGVSERAAAVATAMRRGLIE